MLFIANVKYHILKGGEIKTDVNEKSSVILNVLAGECPYSQQFLAGTVAEKLNIAVGETYSFSVNKTGEEEYNGAMQNVYALEVLGKVPMLELKPLADQYGKRKIVDVRQGVTVSEEKFKEQEA